jgi:DNA-directed RNA polymerase subunit RPC12/RpoP
MVIKCIDCGKLFASLMSTRIRCTPCKRIKAKASNKMPYKPGAFFRCWRNMGELLPKYTFSAVPIIRKPVYYYEPLEDFTAPVGSIMDVQYLKLGGGERYSDIVADYIGPEKQAKVFRSGTYTYFIVDETPGRVKIGSSKTPQSRVKQLQTGNPEQLTLFAVIPADVEKELHSRFSAYRIREDGEWFKLDIRDVDNILSLYKGYRVN